MRKHDAAKGCVCDTNNVIEATLPDFSYLDATDLSIGERKKIEDAVVHEVTCKLCGDYPHEDADCGCECHGDENTKDCGCPPCLRNDNIELRGALEQLVAAIEKQYPAQSDRVRSEIAWAKRVLA